MAYLDDLVTIRDQFVNELKTEMTRRAALVATGIPPPTTYSMAGKSVSWDSYVTMMTKQIQDWNQLIIETGGEGIGEKWIRAYT